MKATLKAGPAAVGFITLCAIGAVLLTLAPAETGPQTRTKAPSAPPQVAAMVEVPLADVIAAQGNAAVKQIRAETMVLSPPDLSAVAVEDAAP